MRKWISFFMALPLLAACAAGGNSVSAGDIASNRYVLQSVDGAAFSNKERTPEIAFSATMRVTGQVCNRFMGQGTLKDGVLTVPQMASTMMLCADQQLNAMEAELAAMLRQGARISLEGDTLTLQNDARRYVYRRQGN